MKQIAYVTDIHLDEPFTADCGVNARAHLEIILEDIGKRAIDELIFGGDIGEPASNVFFFGSIKRYEENLKITLGNHDKFETVIKLFKNKFLGNKAELYYSFEDPFFKHIFLDSSSGEISAPQLIWFNNELHTAKKILLFIHHPILAVPTAVDKLYPLKNRAVLKDALVKCNNEIIIFCGHYHMQDETNFQNISQFITAAASFQIKKDAEELVIENDCFGYRIININEDNISSAIISFQHIAQ